MSDKPELSAEYFRKRYQWLQSFDDDQIREISMCSTDDQLEAGEVYFDLNHPERGAFRADDDGQMPKGACYVSRKKLSKEAWAKLTARTLH